MELQATYEPNLKIWREIDDSAKLSKMVFA